MSARSLPAALLLLGLVVVVLQVGPPQQASPPVPAAAPAPPAPEGDAGVYREAIHALQRYLDDPGHRADLQRSRDLLAPIQAAGPRQAPKFLVKACLRYATVELGQAAADRLNPGEQAMYDFVFGRGRAEAKAFLQGFERNGNLNLYTQIGGGGFDSRRELEFSAFSDGAGNLEGRVVADLGGGLGYFAWMLLQREGAGRVYLADLDPSVFQFVRFAAARPAFRRMADLRIMTVREASRPTFPEPLDVVFMTEVHALSDQFDHYRTWGRDLLSDLRKRLKPGGMVAIMETYSELRAGDAPLREELPRRLRECGYSDVRVRTLRGDWFLYARSAAGGPDRASPSDLSSGW